MQTATKESTALQMYETISKEGRRQNELNNFEMNSL